MHREAYDYVRRAVRDAWRVLEIGSLNVNGSVRPLFGGAAYTGIDRLPGRDVDVVAEARDYDGEGQYDVVVSSEALEHTDWPEEIIACAERALKPGGLLILTAAGPKRAPHGWDGLPLREGAVYRAISPRTLSGFMLPP